MHTVNGTNKRIAHVVASGDDNATVTVSVDFNFPSKADYDAARKLTGRLALRTWSVPGTLHSWFVEEREDTKHGGTYLYCPCPEWKFNGLSCKHTMGVQW